MRPVRNTITPITIIIKPIGGTEVRAANPKNTNTAPKVFLPMKNEITSTANIAKSKPNLCLLNLVLDKVFEFSS